MLAIIFATLLGAYMHTLGDAIGSEPESPLTLGLVPRSAAGASYQLALQPLPIRRLRLLKYPRQCWISTLLVRPPIRIDPFIRHDARDILLLKLVELS
jgi:hypothetical protein